MNELSEKTYLFEQAPIAKAVGKLAVPQVLSCLITILYNLADTYFVGMLNNPIQNAAVTLAAPVMLAFCAVTNLFGGGTASLMSRALGARNHDVVRQASVFSFYSSLVLSLLYSALCALGMGPLLHLLGADSLTAEATSQYLFWTVCLGASPAILHTILSCQFQAEGSSLHASIGIMSGCLMNVVLDPIFILPWGLDLGAAGAGMATCLANCFSLGYFFVLIFVKRGRTYICIDPRRFRISRVVAFGTFQVGIPASIQNLVNVASMMLLNNIASSYGAAAVAAIGISQKIYTLPQQISMGIASGIMPLVGYNYASGNSKRLKSAVFFVIRVMAVIQVVMVGTLLLFPGFFVSLFINDAEIIAIGARLMRGFCLGLPFLCADFLALNIFQATGYGHYSLLFAFLRKIVFEIPAIWLLNRLLPLYGLSFSQAAAEFMMAILAVIFLRKLFRRIDRRAVLLQNC